MSRLYGPVVQVCYLVDEIEPAIRYWSDTLGAGPFFVLPPRRFERLEVHGRPADDHAIIADVALGYAGDLQIELIVPGPAPSTYRDFLAAGRTGLHHIGTASRDFDAQRAAGIAQGMTVVTEGASPLARFAYLEGDPHRPGTIIELIEMNATIETLWSRIKAASVGWLGSDPIRAL